MFELLTFVLLQFLTSSTGPAANVGGNGWGGGDATTPTTTTSVGGNGWGGGDATTTPTTTTSVGGNGWGGGDIASSPAVAK